MLSTDVFHPGDLVSWKTITKIKYFGIILNIFVHEIEPHRQFQMAKISSMTGATGNIMLEQLTLESSI